MPQGLSQGQIAKGLGISQPAVAKAVKRGMPLDSVEAAMEWRRINNNAKRGKSAPRQATPAPIGISELPELSDELAITDRLRRIAVDDFEKAQSIQERAAASRTVKDAEEAHETRKRDLVKSEIEAQTLMHRDQVQAVIAEEVGKLRSLLEAMPAAVAQASNPADPELARDTVADYLEQVFSTLSNTGDALRMDSR
jgi:DNA-binding transcriptional regulator LsrR (DeoR family)